MFNAQINRKYDDFYITPGTTKYINNNCFIPGTLITMADGTVKFIEVLLAHIGLKQLDK